jgi:hypothetical protein
MLNASPASPSAGDVVMTNNHVPDDHELTHNHWADERIPATDKDISELQEQRNEFLDSERERRNRIREEAIAREESQDMGDLGVSSY